MQEIEKVYRLIGRVELMAEVQAHLGKVDYLPPERVIRLMAELLALALPAGGSAIPSDGPTTALEGAGAAPEGKPTHGSGSQAEPASGAVAKPQGGQAQKEYERRLGVWEQTSWGPIRG